MGMCHMLGLRHWVVQPENFTVESDQDWNRSMRVDPEGIRRTIKKIIRLRDA